MEILFPCLYGQLSTPFANPSLWSWNSYRWTAPFIDDSWILNTFPLDSSSVVVWRKYIFIIQGNKRTNPTQICCNVIWQLCIFWERQILPSFLLLIQLIRRLVWIHRTVLTSPWQDLMVLPRKGQLLEVHLLLSLLVSLELAVSVKKNMKISCPGRKYILQKHNDVLILCSIWSYSYQLTVERSKHTPQPLEESPKDSVVLAPDGRWTGPCETYQE